MTATAPKDYSLQDGDVEYYERDRAPYALVRNTMVDGRWTLYSGDIDDETALPETVAFVTTDGTRWYAELASGNAKVESDDVSRMVGLVLDVLATNAWPAVSSVVFKHEGMSRGKAIGPVTVSRSDGMQFNRLLPYDPNPVTRWTTVTDARRIAAGYGVPLREF